MKIIEEMKLKQDVPVVVADDNGNIIFVNKNFEKIFQWSFNEIVGKPISTIIPAPLRDAHHLGFSRFLSTEQSKILNQKLTLKAVKKDGEVFPAEHFIQAEKENGIWHFAASIRPLEEK